MAKLYQIDVAGLAVFVCGIVRNIDPFPMIFLLVPFIQKQNPLVCRSPAKKIGHFRITVYTHILCHQWMVESIIRIILGGISFGNDCIGSQIQKQPRILSNDSCKHQIQSVVRYDLPNHNISPNTKAATSVSLFLLRQDFLWKYL